MLSKGRLTSTKVQRGSLLQVRASPNLRLGGTLSHLMCFSIGGMKGHMLFRIKSLVVSTGGRREGLVSLPVSQVGIDGLRGLRVVGFRHGLRLTTVYRGDEVKVAFLGDSSGRILLHLLHCSLVIGGLSIFGEIKLIKIIDSFSRPITRGD